MIAFDTDVLSNVLQGNRSFVERAVRFSAEEQSVPIVVAEELIRGRLNIVRQAESGGAKISIERAYFLLEEAFHDLQQFNILSYTTQAELLFRNWREQKLRLATHDLVSPQSVLCMELPLSRVTDATTKEFQICQ